MANSYVSLDVFKGEGVLNIVGDGGDARLLSLLESVSRLADRYCNRHFYVLEATRRFDGDGGKWLLLPDLVSIDDGGLRTDDDMDGVFETVWDTRMTTCCCRPTQTLGRGGTRRLGRTPPLRSQAACRARGCGRVGLRRCRSPGSGAGGGT